MEIVKGTNSAETLGASFKALSDRVKRDHGISYGIEVADISKGKIKECGIQNGFIIMIVNDQKIETPEDFYYIVDKILKGNTDEKGLLIKGFYPKSGATRHYAIDLID
jgi:S1-C subfamily serine protease